MIRPEGVNKTGVSGGHNEKEFFNYLDANGIPYKVENKVPHPSVPGVYDVYYKIAKQERGVYTSEFKASTHKKTVYDETVRLSRNPHPKFRGLGRKNLTF